MSTVDGEGSDHVLTILYDETRRSLDQQLQLGESLNNRAQQVLGFSIVIVSVIAATDVRDDEAWVTVLALISLGLFVASAILGFMAWRFQQYRDDPDPEALYRSYRNADEEETRDRVIGNRLESIRWNAAIFERKRRLIGAALWVLVAGSAVLVALVTIRMLSADESRLPVGVACERGKDADDERSERGSGGRRDAQGSERGSGGRGAASKGRPATHQGAYGGRRHRGCRQER